MLSPRRDAQAAKRFFLTALGRPVCSTAQAGQGRQRDPSAGKEGPKAAKPARRVINVEKNAASPKAMADLKASGILPESVELRQLKYLNTIVEQDHRFIKGLVKPGLGFFSFETAGRPRRGYEARPRMRKVPIQAVEKGNVTGQVTLIASMVAVAA
jgi:transposase-like protein